MKVQDASASVNKYEHDIINILKEIDPRQQHFVYIDTSCTINK